MSRPVIVLFGKPRTDRDLSDLTQLALRAWPAVLAREDVGFAEAADAAYRAAESMLEAVRQTEGAYDVRPWRGGAE